MENTVKNPIKEQDMEKELSYAMTQQQLLQTQGDTSSDPAKCTVALQDCSEYELNNTTTAVLIVRSSNNKISRSHHKVSCSLKSLHNNVCTQCKVDLTEPGQYSIQYTPTVRGRHELTVSVDGQQVAGSPFPMFVSIHPTQLGKPVKVFRDLDYPTGIAVNSEGEIFVCADFDTVVRINREEGVRTLLKENRIMDLHKLEVDKENMFCIDYNSNKILKCDLEGKNIEVVELTHLNYGLVGLAVVGAQVMVCEITNTGTIEVYDKELKHVRRIQERRMGELMAISADCHGNLYCPDFNTDVIQVFRNDGIYLRTLGCHEYGENKVNNPYGLCVSGHYVYVCNHGFHNISVFTTDGVYVTSFGQYGCNEGDFDCPQSVCVDRDGFVYVTDYNNHRMQCF